MHLKIRSVLFECFPPVNLQLVKRDFLFISDITFELSLSQALKVPGFYLCKFLLSNVIPDS